MTTTTQPRRTTPNPAAAKGSAERQRVQSQLDPLLERRERFTKELAEAETKARAEQDALADGDGTADAVATADARVRALRQALSAIEGKIAPLQAALHEIDTAAAAAARRALAVELAKSVTPLLAEYIAIREQKAQAINDDIMAVYASHKGLLDRLEEFQTVNRDVRLTPSDLREAGVDLVPLTAAEWKYRRAFSVDIAPTSVLPRLGWIGDMIDRTVEGMRDG